MATANKATLFFAAPDHTKVTGLWFNQGFSGSTTYPNALILDYTHLLDYLRLFFGDLERVSAESAKS